MNNEIAASRLSRASLREHHAVPPPTPDKLDGVFRLRRQLESDGLTVVAEGGPRERRMGDLGAGVSADRRAVRAQSRRRAGWLGAGLSLRAADLSISRINNLLRRGLHIRSSRDDRSGTGGLHAQVPEIRAFGGMRASPVGDIAPPLQLGDNSGPFRTDIRVGPGVGDRMRPDARDITPEDPLGRMVATIRGPERFGYAARRSPGGMTDRLVSKP